MEGAVSVARGEYPRSGTRRDPGERRARLSRENIGRPRMLYNRLTPRRI